MGRRLMNIASVLLGGLIAALSLRLLLRHQYTFLHHKSYTEDPKTWVPTIVPLFAGIWLFIFGLVGFIDEKRRAHSESK